MRELHGGFTLNAAPIQRMGKCANGCTAYETIPTQVRHFQDFRDDHSPDVYRPAAVIRMYMQGVEDLVHTPKGRKNVSAKREGRRHEV